MKRMTGSALEKKHEERVCCLTLPMVDAEMMMKNSLIYFRTLGIAYFALWGLATHIALFAGCAPRRHDPSPVIKQATENIQTTLAAMPDPKEEKPEQTIRYEYGYQCMVPRAISWVVTYVQYVDLVDKKNPFHFVYKFGEKCSLATGGQVKYIARDGDRILGRYFLPESASGQTGECPADSLIFMRQDRFQTLCDVSRKEWQEADNERVYWIEQKDLVRRMLKDAEPKNFYDEAVKRGMIQPTEEENATRR